MVLDILEKFHPMVQQLAEKNHVRILFAIGNNDILDADVGFDAIKRDFDSLCDTFHEIGNVSVKFIDLPFFPIISKFPKEDYEVGIN